VQPRQPAQLLVAERLNAEAETVDAGLPKAGQPFNRDPLGIGLDA
jgi:hypothetical protein